MSADSQADESAAAADVARTETPEATAAASPPPDSDAKVKLEEDKQEQQEPKTEPQTEANEEAKKEEQKQTPTKPLPIGALDKPATTVFVGGINERAPNSMLRELLSACGFVNSWKRVTGADGKLQTFGFCEFADPESTMTCVRLLNRLEIGDKPLIVRVDTGTQALLDEYKERRGLPDAPDQSRDEATKRQFTQVVQRFKAEIERVEEGEIDTGRAPKLVGPKQSLDEMDLDVDKRSIINREIEFFRSRYRDDSPKLAEQLERERERERERRRREKREKERERDRDKEREERREQKRAAEKSAEADDEAIERRRQEKKLLDKEKSYQEELRHWSQRERKKARDAEREREREEKRLAEEAREARRMRDFLAEYDDDTDDAKFYRGDAFRRRLRERDKERELDERDRTREREEVAEARKRLLSEGRDPADVEAICAELDEARDAHLRRLLAPSPKAGGDNLDDAADTGTADADAAPAANVPAAGASKDVAEAGVNGEENNAANDDDGDDDDHHHMDVGNHSDEDMDTTTAAGDALSMPSSAAAPPPPPPPPPPSAPVFSSEEEKKALIKRLIDRIPTLKDELFAYQLDWPIVDAALMESRVKPWINKKIIEYIGEEEAQLTQFVCTKVMDRTPPQNILSEIAMVLDDEAEVFVVKLWRLLIYETEAKKAGLVK